MGVQSGVACHCATCTRPQWHDNGMCQGCRSDGAIQYSWIARAEPGGWPSPPPRDTLQLEPTALNQLIDSWTSLVLVRGLTPHMGAASGASAIHAPPWYRLRGVRCSVRFEEPAPDRTLAEKLVRASDWANQSFIVRTFLTFEEFAIGSEPKNARLPNLPGMREFHHARRFRNAIAHGDTFTDSTLVQEATALFGQAAAGAQGCSVAIDSVLEPLWARLLLYATSLTSHPLPLNPAVVVAFDDRRLFVQSFRGKSEHERRTESGQRHFRIGDIVSVDAL